eukprot:1192437-Prorocentrum_minimum.AAC.1
MSIDNQSCPKECQSAKSSHASRSATFEIISEMTKSANEEPGGVLRNRTRSICVQPDDLRNPRQCHPISPGACTADDSHHH